MRRIVRRLIIVLCLATASVYARQTMLDQMQSVVQEGDVKSLKKLMRKFDREHRTDEERNEVLNELIVSCGEVQKRKDSLSILNNRWDFAACAGGALLAVYGANYLVYYAHKGKNWMYTAGSTVGTLGGLYLMFKGLRHTRQRSRIEVAYHMEEYLEHEISEQTPFEQTPFEQTPLEQTSFEQTQSVTNKGT